MDGAFTMCRTTPECARLDGHDGACNIPVRVMRRTPASRLRYLACQLEKSGDLGVRLACTRAMRDLAQELE